MLSSCSMVKFNARLTLLVPELIFCTCWKMPGRICLKHKKCQLVHLRLSVSILKQPERAETLLGHVLYLLAFYINQTPTYNFFQLTSKRVHTFRHFSQDNRWSSSASTKRVKLIACNSCPSLWWGCRQWYNLSPVLCLLLCGKAAGCVYPEAVSTLLAVPGGL